MGINWDIFIQSYTSSDAFWNITKQRAISIETLGQFQAALRILNEPRFRDKWPESQSEYSKELHSRGLILFFKTPSNIKRYIAELKQAEKKPEIFAAKISKIYTELSSIGGASGANSRIIKSLAERLGFLYDSDEGLIFTPAGRAFIKAKGKSQLVDIIRNQLLKWMYWNPSIQLHSHRTIELFPLRFTVQICSKTMGRYIDSDEYALFVATAKKMDDVRDTVGKIAAFRALSRKKRQRLKKRVKSQLTTIKGYASYVFSAFELTGLFEYQRGQGILKLRGASRLLKMILSDKTAYFRYDDEQLFYDYFGSAEYAKPHREVVVRVSDQSGNALAFSLLQIRDERPRVEVIQQGHGKVILPAKPTEVRVVEFRGGIERVTWQRTINPAENEVQTILSGRHQIAARTYQDLKSKLDEFLQASRFDSELEALVHLKERVERCEVKNIRNIRGGRFEQLVYLLLKSLMPDYFDEVPQWEGDVDKYGIPMHVAGYKHDLSARKGSTLIIIELTLAGSTLGQWKDVSCIAHLDSVQKGLLRFTGGIKDSFALFIDAWGLHRLVRERFAQDTKRVVCPMLIQEFLQALDEYRRLKDFSRFVQELKSYHKKL
jgi:hypothetical protein